VTLAIAAALVLSTGVARAAGPACSPDGRVKIAVKLTPPPGKDLAGVKVVVDYPETSVGIPGFQSWPEVKERVADVPQGFLSAPNDTDAELIMGMAGSAVLPQGTMFSVDFDRCKGAPAVAVADFPCRVAEASTPQGELVDGATCSVELGSANEQERSERGNAR
jgi:hypothetical protein